MGAVDRQRVPGPGGERGWVALRQAAERRVGERRLKPGQISGRDGLVQGAAIVEVELKPAITEHGEITWQRRRATIPL